MPDRLEHVGLAPGRLDHVRRAVAIRVGVRRLDALPPGVLAHLEERAARLERERDAQAQIAAAAERARIARELHDVIAHNVA